MSAAKSSPPAVESSRPPAGGEHHETPIWDAEFADRWAALQPLLTRAAEEGVDA